VGTKGTEAVRPVVECDQCGRAGMVDEAGQFCGEDFCRGLMRSTVEQERDPVPPVEREKPRRRRSASSREQTSDQGGVVMAREWIWRRKRNQSFGFWERLSDGYCLGPVPLDAVGRAAYGPKEAMRLHGE
jgi:hypothetical protein